MKPLSYIISTSLIALFIFSGCSGQRLDEPGPMMNQDAALRTPPTDLYPTPAVKTEGSLFNDDARLDLFSDIKAKNVGDIVTINIVENSTAQKNSQTGLGRNSSVSGKVNAMMGLEDITNFPLVGSAVGSLAPNLDTTKGISGTYNSSFTGSGNTSRKESMTAKISARVIQVLPNGNLVIRGSREVMVNNEKQYINVQGVIRPEDIASDNTVLSTYVADARIDYIGKGDISAQQRQGWLTRALNVIWPF